MRPGISSYTYTWAVGVPGHEPVKRMGYLDLVKKAAELGVGVVQIADNMPLHTLDHTELSELRKYAQSLNIEIESGARGMDEKNLEQYIRISHELDSFLLRFVIDSAEFMPDLDRIIRIINNVIPELEQHNLILALENYERLRVRDFAEIIQKVGNPSVGICLDSVNSMGAGEGIEEVVKTLAPYSVNLHIKEYTITRSSHSMGFRIEGRPAGKGMLNLPWILEQLGSNCRSAILEQWTPPEDELSETISKEDEWARESIEYVKRILNKNI